MLNRGKSARYTTHLVAAAPLHGLAKSSAGAPHRAGPRGTRAAIESLAPGLEPQPRAKMLRSVAAFPSACICVMHLCVTLAAEVRRTLQALCETHQSVRSRYRDALPMH